MAELTVMRFHTEPPVCVRAETSPTMPASKPKQTCMLIKSPWKRAFVVGSGNTWLLIPPRGQRQSWVGLLGKLCSAPGRKIRGKTLPGKRLERKRNERQGLQEGLGGRNRCLTQNPPRAARIAIKNSHILDSNSHILREFGQNPPPTHISNAKPAVKIDPNYHPFCKKDENCIAQSPRFFRENNH